MNIVFMGTPDYATKILKELLTCKDIKVPLLVTQPDKPVGRKQVLTPPHTKNYALTNSVDIEIYQPKTLKSEEAYEYINSFKPDFIVVAAYGQILPKSILDIAPCINLHASLLPSYRGASPIQSSLLNEDKFAGVTSMLMEEGLDTGDILGFTYLELDEHMKVDKLFETLSDMAAKLTIKTLKNFSMIEPIKQKNADTSYAAKIKKSDGLVSFERNSASEIYTKFRAYDPWPGLFLDSGLKLKDIKVVDIKNGKNAGEIISIDENVTVTCKEGSLALKMVQAPSKKPMSAVEYIRGKRLDVGNQVV
ncbi:methionyl-tRNA formyltransferase [Sulfurospirillum arcachonense]|uniref:methionyl-tRNA formyltransferase n=1 Tax=Sulfurospirillum arcachonense TaxID=57666 RepID=UPI000468929B|nr:methionyl-tRNA formyltransferase [Sulfurospirillum arcachonense]